MPQFITIATFTLPSELAVVKSKLESEGILCYAKNELTVQSHNFLSNAIGGIALQVKQEQVEEAMEILNLGGYQTIDELPLSAFEKKLTDAKFRKRLKVLTWAFIALIVIVLIVAGIYDFKI